jgi:hypothetical protein
MNYYGRHRGANNICDVLYFSLIFFLIAFHTFFFLFLRTTVLFTTLGVKLYFLENPSNYLTIIIEKPYVFGDVYSIDFIGTIPNIHKLSRALANDMKSIPCR